ncbi:unnamed protein product [Angiostrongylus costaricensis]|uniref:LAM_G_DOMAIN domain-containing protein n=1 Tax=Angiostrongylus costaricensis TaxID=334426 RepID=A0A158PEY5_ANGCS|nr:unnamed protein product [Angiostrongylus costaricensis]
MIVIRRNSAPSVAIPPIRDTQLGVSTDLLYVGEDLNQIYQRANQFANVMYLGVEKRRAGMRGLLEKLSRLKNDFVFLLKLHLDDDDPLHYLDHKGRGVVGPQEGTVMWNVTRANLPPTLSSIQFGFSRRRLSLKLEDGSKLMMKAIHVERLAE